MDPAYGASGLPGMGPTVDGESRTFLKNDTHFAELGIRIKSDTVDDTDGHTPTTKLRAGLVLVRVEAAGDHLGKYVEVGNASCPAEADIESAVILMGYVNMKGFDGEVEDKLASGLIHGFVDESKVIWGTADAGIIDAIKAVLPQVMFL